MVAKIKHIVGSSIQIVNTLRTQDLADNSFTFSAGQLQTAIGKNAIDFDPLTLIIENSGSIFEQWQAIHTFRPVTLLQSMKAGGDAVNKSPGQREGFTILAAADIFNAVSIANLLNLKELKASNTVQVEAAIGQMATGSGQPSSGTTPLCFGLGGNPMGEIESALLEYLVWLGATTQTWDQATSGNEKTLTVPTDTDIESGMLYLVESWAYDVAASPSEDFNFLVGASIKVKGSERNKGQGDSFWPVSMLAPNAQSAVLDIGEMNSSQTIELRAKPARPFQLGSTVACLNAILVANPQGA